MQCPTLRTWHIEASVQAALYIGVIWAQQGTPIHSTLTLGAALWVLGRVASRSDRQRERYWRDGIAAVLEQHAVECASGTRRDLLVVTLLFGVWGALIGSWLTLADVVWTFAYPLWRRQYRRWFPAQMAKDSAG